MELDRHAHCSPLDRRRDGQRLDMGCDVVRAEERRAPVERRDRGADRGGVAADAARRIAEHARQRALPREPDEHRAARCCRSARARGSARGSGRASCRSRSPGRGRRAPRGSPPRPRPRAAPRGTPATSPTTSSYRGSTCIVRGSPCMCIRQTYAPASATTPASAGSPRSAVTSFTSAAPSSSARRATSAFDVSIETGRPDEPLEHRQRRAAAPRRAARRPRPGGSTRRRRRRAPHPRRAAAAPSPPRPPGRRCRRRRRSCRA